MKPLALRVAAVVLAAALSFVASDSAHATADASAFISFTSLTISPSAGTFQLDSGPAPTWTSQPMFNGQNVGNSDMVNCSAYCSMNPGSGSTLNFYAPASANIGLPGHIVAYAQAYGQSSVQGVFEIDGGSGSVNVCFTVPYTGSLSVQTDGYGRAALAQTELSLTLNGNTVLLDNQSENIGPIQQLSANYSPTLENSVLLNYNEQYTFNLSEFALSSANNVPEPSAVTLLGFEALVLFAAWRWSRERHY